MVEEFKNIYIEGTKPWRCAEHIRKQYKMVCTGEGYSCHMCGALNSFNESSCDACKYFVLGRLKWCRVNEADYGLDFNKWDRP